MTEQIVISRDQLRMERSIAMRAEPLSSLRRTDRGGNKLVDVVHPETGFCIGTRSPLESQPNNVPGSPKPGISASFEEVLNYPQHDPATGHWFVGRDRLVQRMIDTPDGPLKVARVVKPAVAEKLGNRAAAASKVKRAPRDATPRGTAKGTQTTRTPRTGNGGNTGPTAQEIAAYVKSKFNYTGKLSAQMKRAARVSIEHDRQVAEYCAR